MEDNEQAEKDRPDLYSPKSQEALDYFNSCTVVDVHHADGHVQSVPMLRLDEYLRRLREQGRRERRRSE